MENLFVFYVIFLGCGAGGGGAAKDCPQFNDAVNNAPPSAQTPNQAGHPPLLRPVLGKQANFKAPLQIKPGKTRNVRRGYKRYGVPYGTTTPYGMSAPPGSQYPYQPTYGNSQWQVPQQTSPTAYQYPCQPTYGNCPWQASQQTSPYDFQYPYQTTYGNSPWQAPQQSSPADQVVGTLFLFKPNAISLADAKAHPLKNKNPKVKSKN